MTTVSELTGFTTAGAKVAFLSLRASRKSLDLPTEEKRMPYNHGPRPGGPYRPGPRPPYGRPYGPGRPPYRDRYPYGYGHRPYRHNPYGYWGS